MLLNKKIKYGESITPSKRNATKEARAANTQKAKKKIENAINLLRIEGANISEYSDSKKSGCSINTVKKYREFINMQREVK
jgi:hypothetical protein